MAKRHMEHEGHILCTGLTEGQFAKEIREGGKGLKTGRKCYVCKREEGVKSACLHPDDPDKPFALPEIALFEINRKAEGIGIMTFLLCVECCALLGIPRR